ncbi:KAP family P-loop domain protein [Neisseria subflava]|uniref:KAP family P-loop domain protein n=2 Tax=Betaproteobacteria TaxID=28216 RepID=A0A9X9QWG3_NEISU|nr:P-loop NTPase fold protein [Neisseria subflava]MBY6286599.1 KAP family NTPase [Neisseria subflava]VTY02163.1 KAP family P-loop domain protein [Neisseria subflava]
METQALEKTFDTHDEFNRKPIAENIIKLLTSPIDLSPMVIDGGWGTGKTEFCQKLIRLMQQQHPDYQPVYIDAFRSDHSGEPLLALLAEIIKICAPEDTDGQPSEKRKNITRKVARAAGFVMKTVAKAAVGHVLKQDIEDLEEGMSQIINDGQEAKNAAATVVGVATTLASHSIDATIDATVEALLKEQIEAEKNLETLKSCMKELAADKPIILFIDELDRCRPDYAVDMLEVIKHVFDVENVKVVLVTNTKQLRAAINHRYGMEVDAQKYLDKFLKYSFALPEKVVTQFEHERNFVSIHYCQKLIGSNNELSLLIRNESVIDFIGEIIQRNNLSLRETETLVRYLKIFNSLSKGLGSGFGIEYKLLIITAIFIFCFYPKLAEDINRNRTHAEDFARLFNIHSLPNFTNEQRIYGSKEIDILAITLICHSDILDPRFKFRSSDSERYLQTEINYKFLMNSDLGYYEGLSLKLMPQKLFDVLKATFRVLSFEQTPQ